MSNPADASDRITVIRQRLDHWLERAREAHEVAAEAESKYLPVTAASTGTQAYVLEECAAELLALLGGGVSPPPQEGEVMSDKRNWHAIEGPNGLCACGVKADRTVVNCSDLLEAEIQERLRVVGVPQPSEEWTPAEFMGPESAERTLKSIATMLGWETVPPRETLEREINALKSRVVGVPPPPAGLWTCGCGWINDAALDRCAQCHRTPQEGQAVQVPQPHLPPQSSAEYWRGEYENANLLCRQLAERSVGVPPPPPETWIEQRLRMEWWTGHGCPFSALYGDDGEMQCNRCGVDFKRDDMTKLREHVETKRLMNTVEQLKNHPLPAPPKAGGAAPPLDEPDADDLHARSLDVAKRYPADQE